MSRTPIDALVDGSVLRCTKTLREAIRSETRSMVLEILLTPPLDAALKGRRG